MRLCVELTYTVAGTPPSPPPLHNNVRRKQIFKVGRHWSNVAHHYTHRVERRLSTTCKAWHIYLSSRR